MVQQVNASFALDTKALASLQATSRAAPDKALKQAATQFEAVFMNMLLKSMRESIPQDGATDSDATRTYTGMLDQQLAQSLSGKGVGLADVIVKQLSRQMGVAAGPGGAPVPAAVPGPIPGPGAALERVRSSLRAALAPDTAPQAQEFVRNMLPHARAAEQATGIPARFILAQSALESAWGRAEVKGADGTASNNLFGIKAGKDWTGRVVEAATTEYVNGEARRVTQRFRAYGSPAESFADYARLLTNSPRYRGVLAQGRDASGFASALQQAGYATDPHYAEKIARIIRTNLGGIAA
ncbi:MAG: flagellar assembly peptidoglycan hydrolase FlgJ [Betaproteobacteria bacterium]